MRLLVAILLIATTLAGCAGSSEPKDDAPVTAAPVSAFPNAVPTGVGNETWDFSGPYSRTLVKGALEILPPQHIVIPSDIDGKDIEMGLWLPEGDGPFPVMLFSSPYFSVDGRPVTAPGGSVDVLIEELVPHGYAFATHAVRGTAGSDGCNDLMGPLETLDIKQAVDWLGTQSWSAGAVAMTGVSYDGSTPWGVASLGSPYLKTIVPISGVPDMHGLMYRNGSSESRGPVLLNALYVAGGIQSAAPEDWVERAACPDAYQGLVLSGVAATLGTDPTGWWQERNRKAGVEANYEGSVFSIQGLQDWNVDPSQVIPWVGELDKMGFKTKQLLGQWGHSWPDSIGTDEDDVERQQAYRADWKESLRRWLDSELKGLDVDTGPPVQVRDHIGRWRNELSFPPEDATWTNWHLGGNGALQAEPGARETITLRPVLLDGATIPLGQVDLANDFVDFTLPRPDGDLLVSGLPKVHIAVTPLGPGGYIGAYLYDRAPDGELTRVGWTTMNLAFAAGGTERQEVIPGTTIQAMLEIQPMDAAVLDGHELVLRLWVYTDADRLPTIPPAPVQLEIGASIDSVLRLPTIERGPEYYFEPPTNA